MWYLRVIAFLAIFNSLLHFGDSEGSSCPFHLCNAKNLGCGSKGLETNQYGCKLCKCKESVSRPRHCPLHGCTVDLLNCSFGLRQSLDGCTLCECGSMNEESENQTTSHQNNSISIPETSSSAAEEQQITPETLPVTCSKVTCPNGRCTRRSINPRNGCTTCECSDDDSRFDFSKIDQLAEDNEDASENHCPNANELIEGDNMSKGVNQLEVGSNRPKYKLTIGKLRKGYIPGNKYSIVLRANNPNSPFKEYLFEIKTFTSDVARTRVKRRRKKISKKSASSVSPSSEHECNAGYLMEPKTEASNDIWVFPRCPTAAVEQNETTNKTAVTIEWVAPSCGCVEIRVAVVDFTGRQVYFHDDYHLGNSTISSNQPQSNRRKPSSLLRTVCAKTSSGSKRRRPSTRTKHKKKKSWLIFTKCCLDGMKSQSNAKCDRDSQLYSIAKFYRFKVMRKSCAKLYRNCCRQKKKRLQEDIAGARNSTRRHKHVDSPTPRRNRPLGPNTQTTIVIDGRRRKKNRNTAEQKDEGERVRHVRPKKKKKTSNNRRSRSSQKHK